MSTLKKRSLSLGNPYTGGFSHTIRTGELLANAHTWLNFWQL
jgi:hypothetical protein